MKKFEALHKRLQEFKMNPVKETIEDAFGQFPEADFEWKQEDPGEATVYYCDDCEMYHKVYHNWEFKRKNGKRSISRYYGDEDGNWDSDTAWEEGEDPTEILSILFAETNEYFKSWAAYDLYCAFSGKDLLTGEKRSRREALKSAEENINYLYMTEKPFGDKNA